MRVGTRLLQSLNWAMKKAIITIATVLVWLVSVHAYAGQIDEFRFGGTWAQPDALDNDHPENDQVGVVAELLFTPVNIDLFGIADDRTSGYLYNLMNPRPHLGAMINFDDDGTSYAYAGFTWHHRLGEVLFFESAFGISVNNGEENPTSSNRADLGSNVMFHESIGLGANLTEDMTIVLAIEHLSHAGLFDSDNRGLTNASLRLGKKF